MCGVIPGTHFPARDAGLFDLTDNLLERCVLSNSPLVDEAGQVQSD